jgi:hypothetical protein
VPRSDVIKARRVGVALHRGQGENFLNSFDSLLISVASVYNRILMSAELSLLVAAITSILNVGAGRWSNVLRLLRRILIGVDM